MATTVQVPNNTFTDLNLNFIANPITGDVAVLKDAAAVKQAVINLIMMEPYDIPMHPELSSGIHAMLFEPDNHITKEIIKSLIIQILTKAEPRIRVNDIILESITNGYKVNIVFTIIGSTTPVTVSTLLTRTL